MSFQVQISSNLITSSKSNWLSLSFNSLNKYTNSNTNSITKRNLNTSNLVLNNGHLNINKITKSYFSVSSIKNKDINIENGPKIQSKEKKNYSFLELVRLNNNFDPNIHKIVPFCLDNVMLGVIPLKAFQQLRKYNKSFKNNEKPFTISFDNVTFSEHVNTFEKRGKAINDLLMYWRNNNTFECLKGWRDEVYPVFDGNHEVAFNIERSGIALFGFRAYGCHINGYVEDPETLPIPIYTSNTIENNDDSSIDNQHASIFDENSSAIQEKYTLTSKPDSSYSLTSPNPILTSTNSYLYNKNNSNSNYYQSSESKPLTIVTQTDNEEETSSFDNSYSSGTRVSASKPLLSSYSNSSNYINNSYTSTTYNNATEHRKRVSIGSRPSGSQNYPIVITTSRQSNLNSRHPYSTVVEGSTSPLTKQRYNYDYQYQRSVPSTSYYNEIATESKENITDTGDEQKEDTQKQNSSSDNRKSTENIEHSGSKVDSEKQENKKAKEDSSEDVNHQTSENKDKENNENNTEDKDQDETEKIDKTKEELIKSSSTSSPSNTMLKKNAFSKSGSYKRSSFFSQVIESNNFKCPWPDCEQSFASVTLLNAHEIYSHGTPYPPYPLPQPTYAELADARHRLLWHIKNNISTNPLNIYNSNYCSSVQSPSSSIYSSDSPYSNNSAKLPPSATSKSSDSSTSTFTESKKTSKKSDEKSLSENKSSSIEEIDKQKESQIIKKISKMKGDLPQLNIENINNKPSPDGRNTSSKYTQPLSSSSATMQSLRVQIKVDIKEHLFHYLFLSHENNIPASREPSTIFI